MRRHFITSVFALVILSAFGFSQQEFQDQPVVEAGDQIPAPKLLVIYNDVALLKASSGKRISEISNENDRLIRVSHVIGPSELMLLVNDRNAGKCRMWLTDEDGNRDLFEVVVRSLVELPVGAKHSIQTSSKRPLARVINHNKTVTRASISAKDPSSMEIEALASGMSSLTFFDADGKNDSVDVIVVKPNRLMKVGETLPLQAASGKPMTRLDVSGSGRAKIGPIGKTWTHSVFSERKVVLVWNEGKSHTVIIDVGSGSRFLALGDLDSLQLKATEPGLVRVVLTDADNKTEAMDILVTPK